MAATNSVLVQSAALRRLTTRVCVWAVAVLAGTCAGFAQESLVGRYVYVKAWKAELKQGAKTVGTVPDGNWLKIERANGTHYLVTHRDGQGTATQGWILHGHVLLERPLTKEHGVQKDQAIELFNKGNKLAGEGKHADALKQYDQSLAMLRRTFGDKHPVLAYVLQAQSNATQQLGKYAEAEKPLAAALKIRQDSLGGHPRTAQLHHELGRLYIYLGRNGDAEPQYQRCLAIRDAMPEQDQEAIAIILVDLARLYRDTNRYAEATPLLQRNLDIQAAKVGKNHADYAAGLNDLALVYRGHGRWDEAETLFLRGLEIWSAKLGKDHLKTAEIHGNLGVLYHWMGRYAEVEPHHRRCLEARKKQLGADHPETLVAESNIAHFYEQCMGRYAEAEQLYVRCLKAHEAKFGKDHPVTAVSMDTLGELYRRLGRYREAEPLYRRCLAIRQAKLGEHSSTGTVFDRLGMMLRETARYEEAERALRSGLDIRERKLGKDHPFTSASLNNLADLYSDLGRYDEAEPLYLHNLKIKDLKLGKERLPTTASRTHLACLYAATNRNEQALAQFDQVRRDVRLFVTHLLPSQTPVQQRSYLNAHYVEGLSAALSFGLRAAADAEIAEASAGWLANGKAVQHEAQALAVQLQSSGDQRARPVAAKLASLREALTRLKFDPVSPGQEADRKQKIDALEVQDRELTAQLRELGGRTRQAETWIEREAIRAALPARSVLIDIARFDVNPFQARGQQAADSRSGSAANPARYVAWLTCPRGVARVIDLGEATRIDSLVAEVQRQLAGAAPSVSDQGELDAEKALRAKSRRLAELVIDPLLAVEEAKSADEWIFSPDGSLWLTPWAALPLPDDRYVVEQYRVRLVNAGRDLARTTSPEENSRPLAPAIVADPDFDLASDEAIRLARQLTGAKAGDEVATRSVLSDSLKLGRVLRLPSTAAEAELIAPQLERLLQQNPLVHTGKQALEAVVKAVRRPRMLVLSTHGFFLPEQDVAGENHSESRGTLTSDGRLVEDPLLRCGLLLAGCNASSQRGRNDAGDDGILTGLEVVGIDLRGCDLVVLSACETGLGDVQNGEGVAGLRQAFQLAGAEAVLASLWQVPDRETAQLMVGIFERLAGGDGRSVALAETQRQLIRQRRERHVAAHPFYWAAFSVVGQEDATH